jgi:hypothetical protein
MITRLTGYQTIFEMSVGSSEDGVLRLVFQAENATLGILDKNKNVNYELLEALQIITRNITTYMRGEFEDVFSPSVSFFLKSTQHI